MATVLTAEPEQRFVLRGVDWETYQSMLQTVGDHPLRITYDRGNLELISPSNLHERFKKLIDRLLVALAEEMGILLRSHGSTTFKR